MQQINLLTALQKTRQFGVDATMIFQACGAWAFMLILFYSYLLWTNKTLTKQVSVLQIAQNKKEDLLTEAVKNYSTTANTEHLQTEIGELLKDIDVKGKMLDSIAQVNKKTALGFSPYLEAFANAIPNDVWLTDIYLSQSDGAIALSGHVVNPSSVPEFVLRLIKDPLFRKRQFNVLRVTQSGADQKYLDFTLSG